MCIPRFRRVGFRLTRGGTSFGGLVSSYNCMDRIDSLSPQRYIRFGIRMIAAVMSGDGIATCSASTSLLIRLFISSYPIY